MGVSETATQDEIKKAYRQLSKQYHPDVNPNGEEKFKEVAEAYDNIGDDNKRRDYDNRKNNPFANMGGNGFDFNSIFEQMMGGQRQQRPTCQVTQTLVFFSRSRSIWSVRVLLLGMSKTAHNF